MKEIIFVIYVKNQQQSKLFYSNVLSSGPVLDVPGMTEFELNKYSRLGLMPEKDISEILGSVVPNPETGSGIPRCEIYLLVDEPEKYIERLVSSGGKLISNVEQRPWGDDAGYGADPDGHILAFAKNK